MLFKKKYRFYYDDKETIYYKVLFYFIILWHNIVTKYFVNYFYIY